MDSETFMSKQTDGDRPIVLIVDDQYRALQALPRLIDTRDFDPLWVADEHQGLAVLKDQPDKIHIIIIDLKSSGMGGGGFLHQARQVVPHAAILITGPLSSFLYQGGTFYEFSGPSLKRDLNTILAGIAQKIGLVHKDPDTRLTPRNPRQRFGVIIGKSRSINAIYELIENLKDISATVLIQGESGTGKELVARTIHQTSTRKKFPFVAINCGAIPATLIESELFGHERGAFTTAIQQRKGKFEIANKGTLFLDEIAELDKELQVKLLRVLQEKEFQRVGGNTTLKTDVRIIAATSQNLKKAVESGHFREDLFYRLNVVPAHIPPLRERKGDISLLLDHFFDIFAREMGRSLPVLTLEAQKALLAYSYPGNVRELANIAERLFVICPEGKFGLQDLPEEVRREAGSATRPASLIRELPEGGVRLQDLEKELILKTLEMTGGNKLAAAKKLGITRRLLYLRLSGYEQSPPPNCHLRLHAKEHMPPDVTTMSPVVKKRKMI